MFAQIRKISYYLPKKKLSNESDSNNIKGTNRYYASQDEIGSDLAFKAVLKLFNEYHEIDKNEIDFLLYTSQGLDYFSPSSASILHQRIGLNESCGVLDIPVGCAGFVYGLSMAQALISSGNASSILFLLGEIPSKAIHEDDHDLKMIFGDAGVACLVESSPFNSIHKFVFGTDGKGFDDLNILRGGTRYPIDASWLNDNEALPHGRLAMNGLEILRFSLDKIPKLLQATLLKNDCAFSEINHFVFHHASLIIIKSLLRKCAIPSQRLIEYFDEVGNTVSCSIPIALKRAEEDGKLKPGDKIMLLGFGTGYVWAGTIIVWS